MKGLRVDAPSVAERPFFVLHGMARFGTPVAPGGRRPAVPSRTRRLMLYGFFGRVSNSVQLKQSLDLSTLRTRVIADRVSKATLPNVDGFALPPAAVDPGT